MVLVCQILCSTILLQELDNYFAVAKKVRASYAVLIVGRSAGAPCIAYL